MRHTIGVSRVAVAALAAVMALGSIGTPVARAETIPTVTTLVPSVTTGTPFTTITFSASVSPVPTEAFTVAWQVDGAVAATTDGLVDGTSMWQTTLAAGPHSIVAAFSGTPTLDGSLSDPAAVEISLVPTTTTIIVAPNPVVTGLSATITATVAPVPAPVAGHVAWTIDGTAAGMTELDASGKAVTTRSWPDPGSHTIIAAFVEGTIWADSASAPATITVNAKPYAITITADPPVGVIDGWVRFHITVAGPDGGSLKLYRDGALIGTQLLGTGNTWDVPETHITDYTNTFRADYIPDGTTRVAATASTIVEGRDSGVSLGIWASPETAVSGETAVRFTGSVSAYDATGSITFVDTFEGTTRTLGKANLVEDEEYYEDASAVLAARLIGVGTHTVTAVYGGDDWYGAYSNASMEIEVTPDVALVVSGVGVATSTFYPYKDGYRDTVGLRGNLLEPSTVAIRVYSPTNKLVRSFTVSLRSGAYSAAWNGRTSSGTLLPAAKYKVVQTVRDVVGHSRTFTAYTTLSNKRLVWKSATITRYGDAFSVSDYSDFGWVWPHSCSMYRCVNIYGNIYDSWAYVGYRFTLPTAVKYGTLTFKVLGKPRTGRGVPYMSFWNFSKDDEDGIRNTGRSYAWYSTSVGSSGHVTSTNRVWAYVTVTGYNEGWYDVAKVALTYKYAVLR